MPAFFAAVESSLSAADAADLILDSIRDITMESSDINYELVNFEFIIRTEAKLKTNRAVASEFYELIDTAESCRAMYMDVKRSQSFSTNFELIAWAVNKVLLHMGTVSNLNFFRLNSSAIITEVRKTRTLYSIEYEMLSLLVRTLGAFWVGFDQLMVHDIRRADLEALTVEVHEQVMEAGRAFGLHVRLRQANNAVPWSE